MIISNLIPSSRAHCIIRKHSKADRLYLVEGTFGKLKVKRRYKAEKSDFRVILIGLDGGEKLEQTEVLSAEKLFNTIDSMPMRQAEIRKNK